ncbi:unnamed protein product [Cochlearia groenlandica]
MEFFFEMILTVVVALLLSFSVAKLISVATASCNGGGVGVGGSYDSTSDYSRKREIGEVDDSVTEEELRLGAKMEARVVHSERNFLVVDENFELVDRLVNEGVECEESAVLATDSESTTAVFSPEIAIAEENKLSPLLMSASVSLENAIAEETVIRGEEEEEERIESIVEASVRLVNEESGDVLLASESYELNVVASDTYTVEESENKMERKTKEEEEEDDDWEGIERSELEKAFASASKNLEESGKDEEVSVEAKMDLYALHKIATEGSCREPQPMAVMLSARAKWNAWQKLGNMSQEEAMEQYLALVSKEIPGFMSTSHTVGKMAETEASVDLPPNSGSLEDPTTLGTTGVESSQNGTVSGER